MVTISYKGKEIRTNTPIVHLSDAKYKELCEQYYAKPPIEQVIKQLKAIHNGKVMMNKISDYFLKDLMSDVVVDGSNWSINECFECKEILEYLYSRTLLNDKVFTGTDIQNICTAIRIGAKITVRKATNYPIKSVKEILSLYNVNGNYYDYSCGWSARLLGSLALGINYFGTDPNYLLTERLEQISGLYKEVNNVQTGVEIKTQGSEIFVPQWENKIGVAFSSPPYFDLEDYKHGNQSIKDRNYESWLQDYVKPTFQNIQRYLVVDGYFALNIKNTKKYNMLDDCVRIAEEIGFKIHATHTLKNIDRCNVRKKEGKCDFTENNELIVVFTN